MKTKKPTRRPAVTKKSVSKTNKFTSLFSRFRTLPKPLLFALLFAVVAGGFFLYRSFASDGLPTKANELIISYEIGMPHQQFEDNFPTAMPPAMLLYGNGLMLCGDMHDMKPSQTHNVSLSFRQRQLSRNEVVRLVEQLKPTHDKAQGLMPSTDTRLLPTAVGRHIRLNTIDGYTQSSKMGDEQNPQFTTTENLLKAECAKATTAFNPDDIVAETILLPKNHKEAKNAKTELPAGLDVSTKDKETKTKRIKGSTAKALKTKLTREAKVYKQGDKIVRARYVIKVPEYKAMLSKTEDTSGKVSAAAQYPTRWLVVVPQGISTPSWAGSAGNDISANVRNWYQSRVGKTFDISEVTVVRGSKSVSQYATCPAGYNCQGYPSLATFYNMQNEFKRDGTNTNILAAFNTGNNCMGWGGPVVGGADSVSSTYGFAVTPIGAGACDWAEGQYIVAAHEGGHGFGLAHTCDTTLMGGCGYAKPSFWNTALNANQAVLLRDRSLFFNTLNVSAPVYGTQGKTVGYAETFARGVDDQLYHKYYRPGIGWSGWEALGGKLTSTPAWISWGKDRVDVFARGTDNALYHKFSNGSSWSGWQSLGGTLTSAPTVASWGSNRLDVFARGTDNAIWHKAWNGSRWEEWKSIGGDSTSSPAAASMASNRINVFMRGKNGALHTRHWNGSQWNAWQDLGGQILSGTSPAATAMGDGTINAFAVGTDSALYNKHFNGSSWGGFQNLGGIIKGRIAATSWGPGRIDVYARGTDGAEYHKWWDGVNWYGSYEGLGGQISAARDF